MSSFFETFNIAMLTLTKEIISAAIFGFEEQRRRLDLKIAELHAMLFQRSEGATTNATRPATRGAG